MKRFRKPRASRGDDARTTWMPLPDDPSDQPADAAFIPPDQARDREGGSAAVQALIHGAPAQDSDPEAMPHEVAMERARTLLQALSDCDADTVGHLQRTATTVARVSAALGWDEDRRRWATFGALLHDIGKIGVSPNVMYKPGPLSPDEQAVMRDHVNYGIDLVTAYGFPAIVARIVREHHERLDGSGYPHGLAAEAISEEAKLVMLADIADAMLSRRPYKQALTLDDVRRALSAGAGSMFEAELVEPVIQVLAATPPEE